MLLKKYRLKKNSAFNATYKTGNSKHISGITLFCGKPKRDVSYDTKIGFVVGKKVHKRAVKRNRIKRLMREVVRLHIKNNNNTFQCKYISLIFVASTKVLGKSYYEIKEIIEKLMGFISHD